MPEQTQLTPEQLKFLHEYQQRHNLNTLQAALDNAVKALQEQELGEEYAAYARSGEFKEFKDFDVSELLGPDDHKW